MNKAFEKILKRLNNHISMMKDDAEKYYYYKGSVDAYINTKQIVQEVAEEYNDGWILCSERLLEDWTTVLVPDFEGYYEVSVCETRNGVKGFSNGDWWSSANNYIA